MKKQITYKSLGLKGIFCEITVNINDGSLIVAELEKDLDKAVIRILKKQYLWITKGSKPVTKIPPHVIKAHRK